jgi:hypothetical protein
MYKKISHTIVEEHFDHPAVLPDNIKSGLYSPGNPLPLPPSVMTEETMTFRMDSRTLWTRYALGMINYSVSDLGDLASTGNVKNSLARNSANIGAYFTPYYGLTAGGKISDYLTALTANGIKVVDTIKAGRNDIAVYIEIWSKQSTAFAEYLNELNPNNYPKDLLTEMFINLTKFWVEDFNARYNKDFAADAVALDNILKVGVTGVPDHSKAGYRSIADILSWGIISQFPLMFTPGT